MEGGGAHDKHQYFYVIHGHGISLPNPKLVSKFTKYEIVFYCENGETTAEAQKRNSELNWEKALMRFKIGKTMPPFYNSILPNNDVPAMMIFPGGKEAPEAGIYFYCRAKPDELPHFSETLQTGFNQKGEFLLNIIKNVIHPDAQQNQLGFPIQIHWLACREHI